MHTEIERRDLENKAHARHYGVTAGQAWADKHWRRLKSQPAVTQIAAMHDAPDDATIEAACKAQGVEVAHIITTLEGYDGAVRRAFYRGFACGAHMRLRDGAQ